MKATPTVGPALPALRTLAVAAALACSAGAGMAADATVSITSFMASTPTVCGTPPDEYFCGNYVVALDPYQSYSMTAQENGGLNGAAYDPYSADNWNMGLNRLAQTAHATATGNTVQFTDVATQLMTAGFNLAATTSGNFVPPTPQNYADASALQSGTFTLIDENGASVAGSITFDIYYDLSVAVPVGGSSTNYAQTVLSLLASSDAGGNAAFNDGLLTSDLGGAGATSGHLSWTFELGVGESAYYTLAASAISAAAVPEPGSYALFGLGLAGVAAAVRRRRAA